MDKNIDISFFENRDGIARVIVNSLASNLQYEAISNRLAHQIDRDFCFDFLIYSIRLPFADKAIKIIELWLVFDDPTSCKLSESEFNYYLQKSLASIAPVFNDGKNQKNSVIYSAIQFYSKVINSKSIGYLDMISPITWNCILSSILTAIENSFESDYSHRLIDVFTIGLANGRVSYAHAQMMIDNLSKICIQRNASQQFWMILFRNIMDVYLGFPNDDDSTQMKAAHSFASHMIFSLKTISKNAKDQRFIVYESCFAAMMNVLESKRHSDKVLVDPFPSNPLLSLFADCVFLDPVQTIQDRIKLLTYGNLSNDSKWIDIFIKYFRKVLINCILDRDTLKQLLYLSAEKAYITECISHSILIRAHTAISINTPEKYDYIWSTILTNLYSILYAKSSVSQCRQISSIIKQFTINIFSNPELYDHFKITALFNLALTNNIEMILHILSMPAVYMNGPNSNLTKKLPVYSIYLLMFIPYMNSYSFENYGGILDEVLKNIIRSPNCSLYMSSILIASLDLFFNCQYFKTNRTYIDSIFSSLSKDQSLFSILVKDMLLLPIISPSEAHQEEEGKQLCRYIIGSSIITIIESSSSVLTVITRNRIGISRFSVREVKRIVTNPIPEPVKSPYYTKSELMIDSIMPFSPLELFIANGVYSQINMFLVDMGLVSVSTPPPIMIPQTIFPLISSFDDTCDKIKYKILISSISKTQNDPKLNRFMYDMRTKFSTNICELIFDMEAIDSPILVMFNEYDNAFNDQSSLISTYQMVIVVSINTDISSSNKLLYRVLPVKTPGDGFLFPFDKSFEHCIPSDQLSWCISLFCFCYFFGSKNSDILKNFEPEFVDRSLKRQNIITEIQSRLSVEGSLIQKYT